MPLHLLVLPSPHPRTHWALACLSWLTISCHVKPQTLDTGVQVVDAANVLIQDDTKVGTVLLVMAKLGIMEWVPAKQNLRPITLPAGPALFCSPPLFCASPLPSQCAWHLAECINCFDAPQHLSEQHLTCVGS